MLASIFISCSKSVPKVLLFIRDGSGQLEFMLRNEVNSMRTILEESAIDVKIATVDGKLIKTDSITLQPDFKLSEVNIPDFDGFIFPCMATGDSVTGEQIDFVKKIVAQGKPIAAQLGSVIILAKAGALKDKKFAFIDGKEWNSGMYPELKSGIYSGTGVIQDGKIITSGICPWMAKSMKQKDGTTQLARIFALMVKTK